MVSATIAAATTPASFKGVCDFDDRPGALADGLRERSCCWWNGRLDNRKPLLAQAGLDAEASESAILLHLYRRRGVEGLRDAVGDWSAVLWDAPAKRLILASDYAGLRPLYYACQGRRVYWSSNPADLAESLGLSALDPLFVAGFLQRGSAGPRSPYQGVAAVPPGHAVAATRDGITIERFWAPPFETKIRYADEREY